MSFDNFCKLRDYAKNKGIIFFLTPHDDYGLESITQMNLPIIKVGSGEAGNYDFITKVLNKNKITLISTGMYDNLMLNKLNNVIKNQRILMSLLCIVFLLTQQK